MCRAAAPTPLSTRWAKPGPVLKFCDTMHPHKHHPEPLGATVHAAAAAAVRAALPAHRPPSSPQRRPIFHIGGGGIFFWWKTGVLRELQGLERFALRGASAGALAATLTACNVDPGAALDREHALALQYRVFERPLGLIGVWGGMVRAWLEELLPDDAGARCSGGRVQIVVTRWPWLQRWTVLEFQSKREVVEACMASVCTCRCSWTDASLRISADRGWWTEHCWTRRGRQCV